MNSQEGKLEWFGGNQDALNMFRMFVDLSHTWDDLVDRDKEVSQIEINNAFLIVFGLLTGKSVLQEYSRTNLADVDFSNIRI